MIFMQYYLIYSIKKIKSKGFLAVCVCLCECYTLCVNDGIEGSTVN